MKLGIRDIIFNIHQRIIKEIPDYKEKEFDFQIARFKDVLIVKISLESSIDKEW